MLILGIVGALGALPVVWVVIKKIIDFIRFIGRFIGKIIRFIKNMGQIQSTLNENKNQVRGDISRLRGDISRLSEDISQVRGDISRLRDDIRGQPGSYPSRTTSMPEHDPQAINRQFSAPNVESARRRAQLELMLSEDDQARLNQLREYLRYWFDVDK